MISLFLNLFMTGIIWGIKFLWFTGAWISFVLVYLVDQLLLGTLLHIHMSATNYPAVYPVYEIGMIILMLIPIIVTLGYRAFRFFNQKDVPMTTPQPEESPSEIVAREARLLETKALATELMRRRQEDADNSKSK